MSARSAQVNPLAPDERDPELVAIPRHQLRKMQAAVAYLLNIEESCDASEEGEEPETLIALRGLSADLTDLLAVETSSVAVSTLQPTPAAGTVTVNPTLGALVRGRDNLLREIWSVIEFGNDVNQIVARSLSGSLRTIWWDAPSHCWWLDGDNSHAPVPVVFTKHPDWS